MISGTVADATSVAARQAAWLFAACGLLGVLAALGEPRRAAALVMVGVCDLAVAVVIVSLPWQRWRSSAALWIVVPALMVIAAAHVVGLVPARSYGVFF